MHKVLLHSALRKAQAYSVQYGEHFHNAGWGQVKFRDLTTSELAEMIGNTSKRPFTVYKNPSRLIAFINKSGAFLRNQNNETWFFVDATDFRDGIAAVRYESYWFFINKKGEIVYPSNVAEKCQNLMPGEHVTFYINATECYWDARNFSEGLAAVEKNRKWGFINSNGQIIIPFVYSNISFALGNDTLIWAWKGKKTETFNLRGNKISNKAIIMQY